MATIYIERRIPAPADEVFAWLADPSNYTQAPLMFRVKHTKDGQGAPNGVGSIREFTGVGAWFREEITADDAPHELGYLVLKGFSPMKHEGGTVRVTAAPGGAKVTWETDFTMRFSVVERGFTPILRLAFNTILAACEKSLAAARR